MIEPFLDQRNAAARRNDSIESEQIVEMHKLIPSSKTLVSRRKVAAARACVRHLNGGKHRAVHPLEGHQMAAGIDYRYVHFQSRFLDSATAVSMAA